MNKRRILFYIRLSLGLVIFFFIVTRINVKECINASYSINFWYLIVAFCFLVFDRILVAFRWNELLKSKGIMLPFLTIIKISLIGQFLGKFFPSEFAPDAIRAYSLSKYISNPQESISSVVIDRLLGFISLLITSLFAIFLYLNLYEKPDPYIIKIEAIMIFLFMISAFVILGNKIIKKTLIPLNFLLKKNWEKKVQDFYETISAYGEHKTILFNTFIISLLVQVIRNLTVYIGSLALSLDIPLLYCFIFVPVITLILMVPTTIGGIGIAEGAYIYFFSKIGVTNDGAFALSILFRILSFFVILPGGLIYIMKGVSPIKKSRLFQHIK